MAIRRCPYCKAIIDEQDKYCNNCGTQLLFPEDEFVEEEIPGDKIIDEEEEKKEEPEGKDTGEGPELEAELEDEEEDEEEEEEEPEGLRLDADDEEEDEEEKGTDESGERAGGDEKEAEPGTSKVDAGLEENEDKPGVIDKAKDEEKAEEEEGEAFRQEEESSEDEVRGEEPGPAEQEEPEENADKKYEVSLEEDELVIKTKEMTRLTGTTDRATAGEGRPPDTGSLPPWASRIRETPAAVEPEDETWAEPNPLSREWTTDSGIGIPEKITQAALPFADTRGPSGTPPGQEKDHVEEETDDVTAEEETGRPRSLSMKLRAKLVDWIFVTALWVISLWFTAEVVGVSFFRLLFGSPLPVLAFYAILLILYFFLFLYFLGETLGDHYFSE
jgi:hypothetical protein